MTTVQVGDWRVYGLWSSVTPKRGPSLAETVARRLAAAGITPYDPGMVTWRAQNTNAVAAAEAPAAPVAA